MACHGINLTQSFPFLFSRPPLCASLCAQGLERCPLYIVADRATATEDGTYKLKKGRVTQAMHDAYEDYLNDLDKRVTEAECGTIWARTRVCRTPFLPPQ